MFDDATLRAVRSHAARLKIEEAALLAVIEVESAGKAFALVDGRQEPLIRWEGHYFDRRLKQEKRERARSAGLAHPSAGAVKNPASQAARWAMLNRAAAIDAQAAYESASYGVGQVMGAHWGALGYASVQAFVKRVRKDLAGQIEVTVRYIEKFGLVGALQRLDFAAFARGYNGPAYAKMGYHTKMKRAYERHAGKKAVSKADGMLRAGSKGARVRELQALLVRAGFPVKVDGDYGPSTEDAVMAFQKSAGITVDGVAGPETVRKLDAFKAAPEERPGEERVTDLPEVRDAAKGLGPVAIVVGIRDQVAELAYGMLGVEVGTAQTIANVLLAGSAALGTGLALWGLYGWWKSRRTVEAPA